MHTEIVLPAADQKTALTGLSKVVSKSRSLPVLQCIRIARDANGVVTLQATDHDSFATDTVYQPDPGPPAVVLLPLDRFKTASLLTQVLRSIELLEGNCKRVNCPP